MILIDTKTLVIYHLGFFTNNISITVNNEIKEAPQKGACALLLYKNIKKIGPNIPPKSIKVLYTPIAPARIVGGISSDRKTVRLTYTKPTLIPLNRDKINPSSIVDT